MNIDVEEMLIPLTRVVKKFGAQERAWYPLNDDLLNQDTIEINTSEQPELLTLLFDNPDGLIELNGKKYILYIPDGINHRFHVTECTTIKRMQAAGKIERYVITTNTSGKFKTGASDSRFGNSIGGEEIDLPVCRDCLRKLDYNGYKTFKDKKSYRDHIVETFNIAVFFANCSDAAFSRLPTRTDLSIRLDNIYPKNWREISLLRKRTSQCELCHADLSDRPDLLDTHHKNGNKQDNTPDNLIVLCRLCHINQPYHEHKMKLDDDDRKLIIERRKHATS